MASTILRAFVRKDIPTLVQQVLRLERLVLLLPHVVLAAIPVVPELVTIPMRARDVITNLGTTSTYVNNGSVVCAKGVIVWRASNDAEWSIPAISTTSITSSMITVENTLQTIPSIPTMTSDVPIPTTEMIHQADSLSTGAKIGIGLGVSLGVLFFVGAILAAYLIGRRKSRRMGRLPLLSTDGTERKEEFVVRNEQVDEYKGRAEMSAVREPVEIMSS
ncbi:hypothetical protein Daesc_005921 [Daldinia eschscholtzii]|uniref:Mid2 domain-containing protein n=1 Tax=Daldinia eschscholtzii TaxID=292717 RepID=A0AAX6MMA6_9PEZI